MTGSLRSVSSSKRRSFLRAMTEAEAQVDCSEAYADLSGERIKLQIFAMRSMASGAAFYCTSLHATQAGAFSTGVDSCARVRVRGAIC